MNHLLLSLSVFFSISVAQAESEGSAAPVRIGWIGDLTGSTAKWGARHAAQLAVTEINQKGGVSGRPLELIYEDTACNSAKAVTAISKLAGVDKVKFVVGGHCSPDSVAIAPIAQRSKVLMIAAISSSPKITHFGKYVFRLTPVSTRLADLVAPYAVQSLGLRRAAAIYESTDYVIPPAEMFKTRFEENGGRVLASETFNPGEIDFRSIFTKVSRMGVDAIYIGTQGPVQPSLSCVRFVNWD